jgi:hypothetical protein
MVTTCRIEILRAAAALIHQSADDTFELSALLQEMRRLDTPYAESTIRTHVTAVMCVGVPVNHAVHYDDLERVGPGRYRLIQTADVPLHDPSANMTDPQNSLHSTNAAPEPPPTKGEPSVHVAGGSALDTILPKMAVHRPVFHSEADFQLEFGWHLRVADPASVVRLETRPTRNAHLDVLVSRPDLGRSTAIELKYLTAHFSETVDSELFELPHQGAQDIRGYDVIKDIVRVESFVADGVAIDGLVIVLSNDRSYWSRPNHHRPTGAAEFRIHDGTRLRSVRRGDHKPARARGEAAKSHSRYAAATRRLGETTPI